MLKTNAAALRTELAPLYHRYPAQHSPQPAYLYIEPRAASIWATYSSHSTGWTAAEYCNRVLRYPISPYLRRDAVADLLESHAVRSLAERICRGYDEQPDGRGNYCGTYSDDANAASIELEDYLDQHYYRATHEADTVMVWDAHEWVGDGKSHGVTADTTDEGLAEIAAGIADMALTEGVQIDGDILDELTHARNKMRDELED